MSSARTSFNACNGHSLRLLCVALILCLLSRGVNFWKYSSDGRGIACGGEFLAFDAVALAAFEGLFSFFGFEA